MTEDFRIAERAMVARRPRKATQNGPVNVIRVHPEVWSLAWKLAGADAGRLVVTSANTVIVANNATSATAARRRRGR